MESSAKTRLIERITEKPGEDGYSILSDYLAALNHGDWYASNTVITSSHDFIARVFEAWLG